MLKKLRKHWGVLFLGLILISIFVTNFTPSTFLAGWDNLMPELNIRMNIKRSLLGTWQEYQGLGLVGGMGHATDLIRQIILLPFVLILPNNWIRYLWTFGMLALGTFGVYFGLKKQSALSKVFRHTAIIGTLFYLLNFGTIQIFWPPFEAFTTFWGFFPWLIFSFLNVIDKPNKKNTKNFVIWNILAIPSWYIPTLFVVYGLCLGIMGVSQILKQVQDDSKNKKRRFAPRYFTLLSMTKSWIAILLINSFWLLPFIYFLLTNAHHPQQAIINKMSSEQTFLRNQYRGKVSDFLLLRGYYYDFQDAGSPLMQIWQNHLSKNFVLIIGYSLGIIVLIGLIKAPNWLRGLFLLSATALLSATPPFSWLNYLFRGSPFLNQVFRSPFTKFIVPAGFTFALLLSSGLNTIKKLTHNLHFYELIHRSVMPIIIGFAIIIFAWPVFRGNFLYPKMRVKIPQEYFEVFDFFKQQPKTARIANLPQGDFWGWTYYNWQLRGSGFLWYGIEQPILDRAFDVWNLNNQDYYFDLSYALQNQSLELLETVFDKYSVEYVLFDNNVIFAGQKVFAKQALKTQKLLKKSDRLKLAFKTKNISVYKFNHQTLPYLSKTQNPVKYPEFEKYKKIGEPIHINLEQADFKKCNTSLDGVRKLEKKQDFLRLKSTHDDACLSWWLAQPAVNQAWLIEVEHRNVAGYNANIAVYEDENNFKFLYDQLSKNTDWHTDSFVIRPVNSIQKGIVITINSTSFSQKETINDIKSIKLYPIKFSDNKVQSNEVTFLESKSNIWNYKITLNNQARSSRKAYLILPQSFDKGWIGFYFNGWKLKFLKNHTLANNWANAWPIDQADSHIYIVFLPQLLEFLGFGLLGILLIYIPFEIHKH